MATAAAPRSAHLVWDQHMEDPTNGGARDEQGAGAAKVQCAAEHRRAEKSGNGGGIDDEESSSTASSVSASLLEEIRELSEEELKAEWLDAARHDDLTVLRAIHRHRKGVAAAAAQAPASNGGTCLASSSSSSHNCVQWLGVTARDPGGNTALHMASANGHADVVQWLLREHERWRRKHSNRSDNQKSSSPLMSTAEYVMLPNDAGNSALHWAAANGRKEVVPLLLNCGMKTAKKQKPTTDNEPQPEDGEEEGEVPESSAQVREDNDSKCGSGAGGVDDFTGTIDVLRRNNFGRSVLTEAFQGDCQDVIRAVLEHPSAAEERLLRGGAEAGAATEKARGGSSETEPSAPSGTHREPSDETEEARGSEEAAKTATTSIIQDLVFGRRMDAQDPTGGRRGDGSERETFDNTDDESEMIGVRVREVAMATSSIQIVADQDDPEHDRTGLSVWSSSVVASHWMSQIDLEAHLPPIDNDGDENVNGGGVVALELGAGCAVPSLVLAKRLSRLPLSTAAASPQSPPQQHHRHHHVYASDWNGEALDNIRYNLQINELAPPEPSSSSSSSRARNGTVQCHAVRMDWNDPASWEPWCASEEQQSSSAAQHSRPRKPSIIVGADLIYQPSMVEPLVSVVATLLDRDPGRCARFYYVAPLTPRSGGPELLRRLLEEFRLVKSSVAPEAMKRNPLKSQDDDECFLHFQELLTSDFRLYEFAWK